MSTIVYLSSFLNIFKHSLLENFSWSNVKLNWCSGQRGGNSVKLCLSSRLTPELLQTKDIVTIIFVGNCSKVWVIKFTCYGIYFMGSLHKQNFCLKKYKINNTEEKYRLLNCLITQLQNTGFYVAESRRALGSPVCLGVFLFVTIPKFFSLIYLLWGTSFLVFCMVV